MRRCSWCQKSFRCQHHCAVLIPSPPCLTCEMPRATVRRLIPHLGCRKGLIWACRRKQQKVDCQSNQLSGEDTLTCWDCSLVRTKRHENGPLVLLTACQPGWDNRCCFISVVSVRHCVLCVAVRTETQKLLIRNRSCLRCPGKWLHFGRQIFELDRKLPIILKLLIRFWCSLTWQRVLDSIGPIKMGTFDRAIWPWELLLLQWT